MGGMGAHPQHLNQQQLTQNVATNNNIDFGKYNQLDHDMLFNIQSTQQPVGMAGQMQQQDGSQGLLNNQGMPPNLMSQFQNNQVPPS